MAVLDQDINPLSPATADTPSAAAIEGATAYLRLGGRCHGCGMATVTLSQGIDVKIRQQEADDTADEVRAARQHPAITRRSPQINHVVDASRARHR